MEKVQQYMKIPYRQYQINHGSAEYFKNHYSFKELLDNLFKKDWIVYTKEAFNGAQSVINYLGRYTHRIAISNRRIEDIKDDDVIYKAKDYSNGGKMAPVSVKGTEFIRTKTYRLRIG